MAKDDEVKAMVEELWWIGVLQGAVSIFFGLAAIFWPELTLVVLLYLSSGFFVVLGVIELINGLVSINKNSTWWLTALVGLFSLGAGVYLIRNPGTSLQVFIIIVGLLLVARGLIDLVRAFTARVTGPQRAIAIVVGIVAIVAGIAIMAQPITGGVAFVWILGLFALVYGALIMTMSFWLRNEVV